MTALDIFRATVEHRHHTETLFHASFTPDLAPRVSEHFGVESIEDLFERIGVPEWVEVVVPKRPDPVNHDFTQYYLDIVLPKGVDLASHIDIRGVLRVPGSSYHFTRSVGPLRNATTLDEVERFPLPSPEDYRFDPDGMRTAVDSAHAAGKPVSCSTGHMYEEAWQIRGYEEFLIDMIAEPDIPAYLLEQYCIKNIAIAETAAKAGVDLLKIADDVANQNSLMFSIDLWRKFIKSRWARVIDAARAIKPDIEVWYHTDGNALEILPELIEIGITILNPVQPECMNVNQVKREYGDRLVFDGTIGTQSTMPFGTPNEVRRVIQERKRVVGADGALIISPTHVLEPEVPLENIEAFFDECRVSA